jgi:hypothetical protein
MYQHNPSSFQHTLHAVQNPQFFASLQHTGAAPFAAAAEVDGTMGWLSS